MSHETSSRSTFGNDSVGGLLVISLLGVIYFGILGYLYKLSQRRRNNEIEYSEVERHPRENSDPREKGRIRAGSIIDNLSTGKSSEFIVDPREIGRQRAGSIIDSIDNAIPLTV